MFRVFFLSVVLGLCECQVVRVVEVPAARIPIPSGRPVLLPEPIPTVRPRQNDVPVFEFLKPKGVRISIPGPYPPSNQYRLVFHININKEFEGWKRGELNEGIILGNGQLWSYTFPNLQVFPEDTIYYWIEVHGFDWEKGYKGNYKVSQPAPLGGAPSGEDNLGDLRPCRGLSATTYSGGRRACLGEQIIHSYTHVAQKYKRRGSQYFMQSVRQIAGPRPEETFTVFSNENIIWNSTHNAFVPTTLEQKYGPSAVDATNFTIPDCTSDDPNLCSAEAMGYLILPPIISARHSTEKTFSFCYGVLEVTAKLPRGDWIVPELWLLPKDNKYGNSSGRIILAMSRGNLNLSSAEQDYSGRVLEAGVETASGARMFKKIQDRPWSSDYHKFKLVWTPDKLEFLVDEEVIGKIQPGEEGLEPGLQGSKMAPFDQEFYLVFGLHVGGDKDFPDSIIGKPWKNYEPKNKLKFWFARDSWLPTWGIHSVFLIKGLSITALHQP
ncbi:beta-1,3-glucan-binding protein-like [Homalodisca vitripennis]|uniref:beta-1,3-glucan-binding protein-like n=1 Tax=Homalodisca vitripennis TaxID=197043 RepID=UPI001EEBCA9B|nr:beta-1,3-glucan-binding protein-like [Homalodisca vitripennis]